MAVYAEPGEGDGTEGSSAAERGGDRNGGVRGGDGEQQETGAGAGPGARIGPGGLEMSTSIPIIERLRLYPIALVICWSWATVNRVHEALHPKGQTVFWLFMLQYTFQVRSRLCLFCV